ncbi:hypothetical protein [Amycolatopsis sp. cmx-4-68]|uniref:hypothetical protein n=1 Tax=Amycolatopsis sp. cmx-4-68 TaxID=2790938 RepID=UPI00397B0ECA
MNASASAHAWLAGELAAAAPTLWADWAASLRTALGAGADLIWTEPWPHDYWVSQGIHYALNGVSNQVIQTWDPGRTLEDWPLLEAGAASLVPPGSGRTTDSAALDRVLAAARPLPYAHEQQLERFTSMEDVVPAEVVRAWVDAVFGHALGGLAFAATDDAQVLADEGWRRFTTLWQLTAASQVPRQVHVVRAVEALYTAEWEDGEPSLVPAPQGQPVRAADHWHWLGCPLDAADLREALHTAAGLLVSPPLLRLLIDVTREGGELVPLGLCVLRRWALGLRAMAWLEEAITHPWRDVRLVDVSAFAFAAVAPWWPRPSLAVSHRSAEVKPELIRTALWGSAHVAVDAMTVPNRETNTGLVWRLFAATPSIIRVRSATYEASEWCRREAELLQYLLDGSDFFRGRVVADVTDLPAVDRTPIARRSARDPDFPPNTLVLDVPSFPPLIVTLFAAMGTLRLLNGLVQDVGTVNRIADALARGRSLSLEPPTNDPGGWQLHYQVFGALARAAGTTRAPVRLKPEYPQRQLEADLRDYVLRIPDLRRTTCSGLDVLAALEWDHELRRWFTDAWGSQRAVVDCRPLDVEAWSSDAAHGVQRGILEVRTETLLFIVQDAGQKVRRWPVIDRRDTPILTQHVEGQLRWLSAAKTLPTWIAAYTALPEFEFGPGLIRAAIDSLAPEFAAHTHLSVPRTYPDVFAMEIGPDDPLREYLDLPGES